MPPAHHAHKLNPKEWSIDDFEIGKRIGTCQHGQVLLAREKRSKFIVALKELQKKSLTDAATQEQLRIEIEIQSHLRHENICHLYGFFYDEKRIYLILEFSTGGQVYQELIKAPERRFDEARSAEYVYQVLQALKYLQSKRVIHGDINPKNLLNCQGTIKLSNFGGSCHIPEERKTTNAKSSALGHRSPETVASQPRYDNSADIKSLAYLTFFFLTGDSPPFPGDLSQDCPNACEPEPPGFSDSAAFPDAVFPDHIS